MRSRTKTLLDAAVRWSPAQPAFGQVAARRLAVLAYHDVSDPEQFGQHLDHLQRTARVVALDDVLETVEGSGTLPSRAVLITFDDGHRSVLDAGMRLLRERGLPAVVFVIAGVVGTDRPFWWSEVVDLMSRGGLVDGMPGASPLEVVRRLKRVPDEQRRTVLERLRETTSGAAHPVPQLTPADLRSLESAGIAIGSHTWSHPSLPRCSDEAVRAEIEDAHRSLTDQLGHAPIAFAYPYGDHDPRAAWPLLRLGYRAGFLFDHRLSPLRPHDPLAISRLRVNSTTTLDRFRAIVSGLHPTLHRIRGGG